MSFRRIYCQGGSEQRALYSSDYKAQYRNGMGLTQLLSDQLTFYRKVTYLLVALA